MIGIQLRSIANQFRFHARRAELISERALAPPCDFPRDQTLIEIMLDELRVTEAALPWVESDPRLGWHQSIQAYKYDAVNLRDKITLMRRELRSVIDDQRSEGPEGPTHA
jgi:hypothetical protein